MPIQAVSSAAQGIASSVFGGMAVVHGVREAARLGAATRADETASVLANIKLQNQAFSQQRELRKQQEEQQKKLEAEGKKIQREVLQKLEQDAMRQREAEQQMAQQQAELLASALPPPPEPFRMPVWGWVAIGVGALGIVGVSVALIAR